MLLLSEYVGRLVCQEHSVRGAGLEWEAHRGAGPRPGKGVLGIRMSQEHVLSSSAGPEGVEVGRGVTEKIGRGHVRSGLGGAGLPAEEGGQICTLRRSPWWPEPLEITTQVWFMAQCPALWGVDEGGMPSRL